MSVAENTVADGVLSEITSEAELREAIGEETLEELEEYYSPENYGKKLH